MEEDWKLSSVALRFQGVLISICSSEPEGSKDGRKTKSLLRPLPYSSITLTSLICETIQQVISYNMYNERMEREGSALLLWRCFSQSGSWAAQYPLVCCCSGIEKETMNASETLVKYFWLTVKKLRERRINKNNLHEVSVSVMDCCDVKRNVSGLLLVVLYETIFFRVSSAMLNSLHLLNAAWAFGVLSCFNELSFWRETGKLSFWVSD